MASPAPRAGVPGSPVAGKAFAISGTTARRSKDEAQMSIEVRGGRGVALPSRRNDCLLAGDEAAAGVRP